MANYGLNGGLAANRPVAPYVRPHKAPYVARAKAPPQQLEPVSYKKKLTAETPPSAWSARTTCAGSPISRTPWRNTCRGYPLAVHSCSQLNSPCFPFSPVPLSVRSTPLYPTGAGRLYAPNQRPGSAACGTAIVRTTRRPPPKASLLHLQSRYRYLRCSGYSSARLPAGAGSTQHSLRILV